MDDGSDSPAVERLSTLLHLQDRARAARRDVELGFVIVNETHGLVPYRQAALWLGGAVRAVSGVPEADRDTPFVQWLGRVAAALHAAGGEARPVRAADLPAAEADQWADWLPVEAAWIPLRDADGAPMGGLLVARERPFAEAELGLLAHAGDAYAHAWAALHRPGAWERWKLRLARWPRRRRAAIAVAALACLFIPVRLSVLAPAETVPANPVLVRAPIDGVVDRFHVAPNDSVVEGTPLFDLDPTTILSRLDVARQTLATIETEYRQAGQQALVDTRAKARLAILRGRREERQAEVDYLRELLGRSKVAAPRPGVVVFDAPSAWLGRPVAQGEKVMILTDPHDTEIEAWLSAADAIPLDIGAPVSLFLNVDPTAPVRGRLRILGYEAQVRPDGSAAYRVRAAIDGDRPRVGLKGTARLDGERVPLIYWLLRKPLAAARQWLGV